MIMKISAFFTNKHFFIITIAVICGTATREIITGIRFEQTQKATKNAFFNFEIKNKSSDPIWVELSSSGNMLLNATPVAAMLKKERGYLRSGNIDTMRHLNVTIYRNNNQSEEHHIYADGKTIFLTWDGKKLRPQTGTLFGLSKRTDSGLSLKNNVTIDDIDPIWQK